MKKTTDTEEKSQERTPGDSEAALAEHKPAAGGFGEILREKREKMGFAVGDMVGRLRISVKQLRAIENETVENLPEPVYVRGFIRAYAKALELDPQPLIDDYNERFAPADAPAAHQIPDVPYSREEVFQDRTPSRWWRYAAIGVSAFAILAGIWALTSQSMKEDQQAAQIQAQGDPLAVNPKTAQSGVSRSPALVSARPAEPEAPKIPGVTVSADDGSSISMNDHAEVRLRFRTAQSCWVRVSRIGDDRTVFEQEIPVGAVRIVRGEKPMRVILGNPSGVGLQINGVEFDFKNFVSSTDGTARFRLH